MPDRTECAVSRAIFGASPSSSGSVAARMKDSSRMFAPLSAAAWPLVSPGNRIIVTHLARVTFVPSATTERARSRRLISIRTLNQVDPRALTLGRFGGPITPPAHLRLVRALELVERRERSVFSEREARAPITTCARFLFRTDPLRAAPGRAGRTGPARGRREFRAAAQFSVAISEQREPSVGQSAR